MTRADLYGRLPVTVADRWWIQLARASVDGRVLELGGGSGRVSDAIADEGIEVVAVEHDPAMLASLRQRVGDRVRVIDADVRALPDLGRFGVVMLSASLLNELATPSDRAAAVAGASAACRHGGRVAMQLLGPWWLAALPARSSGSLVPLDGSPAVEVVIEAADLDAWKGRRRATLTYRFPDGAVLRDVLDAAVVTPVELTGALEAAGLALTDVWGPEPGGGAPEATDAVWHVVAQPVG